MTRFKLFLTLAAVGMLAIASLLAQGTGSPGAGGGGGTNPKAADAGAEADAFMVTSTNANSFSAGKTQTVNGTLSTTSLVVFPLGNFQSGAKTNIFFTPGAAHLSVFGTNVMYMSGAHFVVDASVLSTYTEAHIASGSGQIAYLFIGSDAADANRQVFYEGGNGATMTYTLNNGLTLQNDQILHASGARVFQHNSNQRLKINAAGTAVGINGALITNIVSGTLSVDLPSLNTLVGFSTNLAVTGVRAYKTSFQVSGGTNDSIIYKAFSTNDGTVWLRGLNVSAGTVDASIEPIQVIGTTIE